MVVVGELERFWVIEIERGLGKEEVREEFGRWDRIWKRLEQKIVEEKYMKKRKKYVGRGEKMWGQGG